MEDIIKKVKDFTLESLWSRNVLLADELCKFEQKVGEGNRDYVTRFSNLETRLKTEEVELKGRFLAAILLNKSKIPQHEKNNILANFDLENDDQNELLKKIKKKIRDLDVMKEASKEDVKETFFNDQFNRRSYRDRSRSRSRFSKGKDRNDSRNRDRNRTDSRNGDRNRTDSKNRDRNRSQSRGRFNKERPIEEGSPNVKRTYKCDKFKINTEKSIFENKVENKAVLDSGCPEMVGGTAWLKTYEHSLGEELKEINKEDMFKFGDTVYKTIKGGFYFGIFYPLYGRS